MDRYRTDGTLKKNFSWPDVVRHFEKGSVAIDMTGLTEYALEAAEACPAAKQL